MSYLILDLDETVIVAVNYLDNIDHSYHELSAPFTAQCGNNRLDVRIINPEELTRLIETACTQYDGIIILTAGLWSPTIRSAIANQLPLTAPTKAHLETCLFHSPLVDNLLFGFEVDSLMFMEKSLRWEKIVKANKSLHDKYAVLLDDNEFHLRSFYGHDRVRPVQATTKMHSKDFYDFALNSLKSAANEEQFNQTTAAVGTKRKGSNPFEVKIKKTKYDQDIYYYDCRMDARISLKHDYKTERKAMRFFQAIEPENNRYLSYQQQNEFLVNLDNNPISFTSGEVLDGEYNFCLTCEEYPRLLCNKTLNHAYLANGKKTLGIGTLTFHRGKLLEISNQSSHYCPTNDEMIDVIRAVFEATDGELKSYTSYSKPEPEVYEVLEILNVASMKDLKPLKVEKKTSPPLECLIENTEQRILAQLQPDVF